MQLGTLCQMQADRGADKLSSEQALRVEGGSVKLVHHIAPQNKCSWNIFDVPNVIQIECCRAP